MMTDQTTASLSRDEFIRNLVESGLSAADLVSTVESTDGLAVARELIDAGHLTAYQADAVLERRFADLLIGNYEILDKLGAGGMGAVYKARHRRMKRIVALKVLSRDVAGKSAFAQRFQREVETIARLAHPNIVMAFDADEADCGPFLVMEFVNGRDLASHVERGGPFSVAEAVDCTRQAGLGLAYAHSQGIVHRDIKPANLIRDLSGMIKVADLGLARLNTPDVNASITQAGGVLGTMDYMPPEQALDSTDIDHRADIYSLGYTLYFLIQGRTPYTGGSIMALLLKHRDAPIPALGEGRLDVPPELEAIYRRMVAKKPDDRFPTMAEAVQALADLESRIRFDQKPPAVMNLPPTTASAGTTTEFLSPGSPGWDSTIVVSNSPIHQPSSDGATRLDGLVVVLVEPSRTQAGIISRYLTSQGAKTVLQTGNGHDAIALALKERADVVISSMHLSDMTGATLSSKILADPLCDHLGVVLATSAADLEQSNQFPVSKRFVVLPKPFDARQLALRVTSVAKQK